ncbi:hypothetical protein GCM10022252_74360 [Streptosporangium oxazolinicum]|uniref:DNA-binding protein n=1 Tax=Streptosporangium oxazolinicum TaxID=909287 RepID=A0ABP8BL85_9ACTN
MSALSDTDRLLQDLEREGLVFHLGVGGGDGSTVWFASEFREQVIADRLAMLPDEPTISVATAAVVLNVPLSHVIAEVRARTLAGHDNGRQIRVQREALAQRITSLGLPRPATPPDLPEGPAGS